ncbi:MAG TPA: sensor domain-containing diguanylate cyclase [Blastocatellia bacterium]|nr:sensor domain-containing diguanylate cyclase [Blastocatellia bacterium]
MQEGLITSSIFESAMRLHESLDTGDVIASAVKLLSESVAADSWAVFLRAEQADRLELVRATNPANLPGSPLIEIGSGDAPIVRAVTEQETVVTGREASLEGNGAVASLCIPLITGARVIGAVQATRLGSNGGASDQVFSAPEVSLAELICDSLSRAVANAIDYSRATRQSLIDDLTRLYNVRYLYQTLDNEIRRARRYGSPVSVIFIDLDGFKGVNDRYGHRAGSFTLKEVARVLVATVREADFVARYGGDEFVLMLPETTSGRAAQVAERVRQQIEEHRFTGGGGADIRLTASFGVASYPEHALEAERLIELADAAMYEAKQREKNNVRLAAS